MGSINVFLKLWYFTSFSGLACFTPFIALYYRNIGLDTREIGFVFFLRPLISIPMNTLWTILVDYIQKPKLILLLTVMLAALSRFLIVFCTKFWQILFFASLSYVFSAPGNSLSDSIALRSLSDKSDYGKVRLWGAVGWGLFGPIVGALMEMTEMAIIFPLHLFVMAINMLSGSFLPSQQGQEAHQTNSRSITEIISILVELLSHSSSISFFLVVILMGMGMGCMDSFVFLYLQELGGTSSLMGLSLTVMCLAEIPAMYISGYMARMVGFFGVLCVVMLCYILRLVLYSLIKNPWLVLPIELLHGITFGWGSSIGTMYAGELAPRGLETTTQGLFSTAYWSVGFGLGNLLSGFVYERFGAVILFRGMAFFLSLSSVVFFVFGNQPRKPVTVINGEEILTPLIDGLNVEGHGDLK